MEKKRAAEKQHDNDRLAVNCCHDAIKSVNDGMHEEALMHLGDAAKAIKTRLGEIRDTKASSGLNSEPGQAGY